MVKPGRHSRVPTTEPTNLNNQHTDNNNNLLNDISQYALAHQESLSEQDIQNILVERMGREDVYTRLGGRCLLFMNIGRELARFSENTSKEYAAFYKGLESLESPNPNPPHLFDMVASAYFHMLREKQDQSILLIGSSGSGKSESHRLITRNLCDLSKSSKKKSKVQSAILRVDSILSAFGNAWSANNRDSSFLGTYTEYQFDKKGKMVGAKYIDYFLDKSRLTEHDENSWGTFHVFYYMMAGATAEEKELWHISGRPEHYFYLSQGKGRVINAEDGQAFKELRENLIKVGIGRRQQAQIFQILAAILHLGNVVFIESSKKKHDECRVKNFQQLQMAAELLGIAPSALEDIITTKTKKMNQDLISILLDVDGAEEQRDAFARTLYMLVFSWIMEQINNKVCREDNEWENYIAVLDYPGFCGSHGLDDDFQRLLCNFTADKIQSLAFDLLDTEKAILHEQGFPNQNFLDTALRSGQDLLDGQNNDPGLWNTIDISCLKNIKASKMTETIYATLGDHPGFIRSEKPKYHFGVHHYNGVMEYDTRGFLYHNNDVFQSDFAQLIRGSPQQQGSSSAFMRNLFSDRFINVKRSAETHGQTDSLKLKIKGSNKADEEDMLVSNDGTISLQVRGSLAEIFECIKTTRTWNIFHLKPNPSPALRSGSVDADLLKLQIACYLITDIPKTMVSRYTCNYEFVDFVKKYGSLFSSSAEDYPTDEDKIRHFGITKKWTIPFDINYGKTKVFISQSVWKYLEDGLRQLEFPEVDLANVKKMQNVVGAAGIDYREDVSDAGSMISDNESHYSSEFDFEEDNRSRKSIALSPKDVEKGNMGIIEFPIKGEKMGKSGKPKKQKPPKEVLSKTRTRWLCCTWCLTFWIPTFCISCCGGLKSKDQQIAWREKVALCMIILMMCAFILFIIIGLNFILCPSKKVLSPGEVSDKYRSLVDGKPTIRMYGNYYVIPEVVKSHLSVDRGNKVLWEQQILGQDVSQMFSKQPFWGSYCEYNYPGNFQLFPNPNPLIIDGTFYDHHRQTTTNMINNLRRYLIGEIVWDYSTINNWIAKDGGPNAHIVQAYDQIYDVTSFFATNLGTRNFLGDTREFQQRVQEIFEVYGMTAGKDATNDFEKLRRQDYNSWVKTKRCLDRAFKVGVVDHRKDPQCVIPDYILLASSIILVAVIGFKFLAALNLSSKTFPQKHDKFVICQVPCYTEGEASLLRTLRSLALTTYDDKHKLLFVIADGMIIGSGNDRPTPRIALDLLGVDPTIDPPALSFQSLGEGQKQMNAAKVYSGLYQLEGHAVPFIVVAKVGKSSERQRPGNRGKRDSQMILMRFLSRVYYNEAMTPLELEIYHQMKNVIGVDPSYYEYVLMVDADTEVFKDALSRLVSTMVHDGKIMGLCGETKIANPMDSFVTMIQVYEYFISHYMAKAFESLFGSVTCLPGCFCMYRVRSPQKNAPLLVAPPVIKDYSENNVNTLHMKNLLHLGEDRYLTTLMLKHFPTHKLMFTADAKCKTYCPDRWNIIMSQRRRWINSTVHNLLELVYLPDLCGFCCFSMRFVVFIDLFATVIQPAALLYICYLVFLYSWAESPVIPYVSLIMIAAIYGFQIIILMLRLEWEHLGWMVLYILATPLFSFYLPIYSFWHFDDFSWGQTRRIVGDDGKEIFIAESEEFDPSVIPLKKWSEYEQEILYQQETGSVYSRGSVVAPSDFNDNVSVRSSKSGKSKRNSKMHNPPPSSFGGSDVASMYGGYNTTHIMMPGVVGAPMLYGGMPPMGAGVPGQRTSYYSVTGVPVNMPVVNNTAPQVNNRTSMISNAAPDASSTYIPSDQELLQQIKQILSTADLMTITKKKIREELSKMYGGIDLSSKKDYIHRCIDSVLRGEL